MTHRTKPMGNGLTRREALKLGAAVGVGTLLTPAAGWTAAPAVVKKASLTYWTTLDHKDLKNPRSRAEFEMVELFRKKQPDIEIVPQTVPWQTMDKQILQAAAAGKAPAVAVTSTQGVPLLAPAGVLLNLDEYVGKGWSKEEKEDFLLPRANTVYDGKNYGYYWNSVLNNLYLYRADLFEAKKVGVPKSWEEMGEAAKAVTDARVAGYVMGLSREGNAVNVTNWLVGALWSAGTDWLDDKGLVAFNSENGAKPFQWLYDMVHKWKATPEGIVSMNQQNQLDGLKAGTIASTSLSSNQVGGARAGATAKQLAIVPAPGITPDRPQPAFTTGKFIVMTKDCKEREAAALFIESMLSPEAQVLNARIASELPSRASALKDPWFNAPEAADMKMMVQFMQARPRKFQYHPKNNILGDLMAQGFQAIIAKRMSVKDALDDMAKKWEAELKNA
jgi:ABC-type glycerol-3-phosphate transport system substrate-binding protein